MAGLYIHVPFCLRKCAYCDFYSLPRLQEFESRYIAALETEWLLRKNEIKVPATVYFGGGTPSLLSQSSIESIAKWLPAPADNGEFTVEFNPEDVDSATLHVWKSLGANRVSMGVQSFHDAELAFVGRRHSSRTAIEAYATLRNDFDNVSIDLIIGLPGQTISSLMQSVSGALSLRPEHLSVYILGYEEGTRLWAMRRAGKVRETDDETLAAMYLMVCSLLAEAGYEHYEISNFALPGFRACHNAAYWRNEPYLGLGPGAHSFTCGNRSYNPSDIKKWLEALENGINPAAIELESPAERVNDYIMVRLRTAAGLDLDSLAPPYRQIVERNLNLLPPGRVNVEGSRVVIPEKEWLVSDDTLSRLFVD